MKAVGIRICSFASVGFLFDLLFQSVKRFGGKEISQGDAEAVTKHLDCYDPGVAAFTVDDFFDG